MAVKIGKFLSKIVCDKAIKFCFSKLENLFSNLSELTLPILVEIHFLLTQFLKRGNFLRTNQYLFNKLTFRSGLGSSSGQNLTRFETVA